MIGRFDVSQGEAPPYHKHTREDEVFMLIKGTALIWVDDQETQLSEGGIVILPKNIPHAYRFNSPKADLLMINTPAGIEGMFRYAGRDRATPQPDSSRSPWSAWQKPPRTSAISSSGHPGNISSLPPTLDPPRHRGLPEGNGHPTTADRRGQ